MNFYKCKHCGQIITKILDTKVPIVCCGENMVKLEAGTVDAALEKHIPVYSVNNNIVEINIGEVDHPMLNEHYIQFIAMQTNQGFQIKHLKPEQKPKAIFLLNDNEKIINIYEYCNLHGLWKK